MWLLCLITHLLLTCGSWGILLRCSMGVLRIWRTQKHWASKGLAKEQCVLVVIVVFPHLVLEICWSDRFALCNLSPVKQHKTIEVLFACIQCNPLSVRANWYVLTQEHIPSKKGPLCAKYGLRGSLTTPIITNHHNPCTQVVFYTMIGWFLFLSLHLCQQRNYDVFSGALLITSCGRCLVTFQVCPTNLVFMSKVPTLVG